MPAVPLRYPFAFILACYAALAFLQGCTNPFGPGESRYDPAVADPKLDWDKIRLIDSLEFAFHYSSKYVGAIFMDDSVGSVKVYVDSTYDSSNVQVLRLTLKRKIRFRHNPNSDIGASIDTAALPLDSVAGTFRGSLINSKGVANQQLTSMPQALFLATTIGAPVFPRGKAYFGGESRSVTDLDFELDSMHGLSLYDRGTGLLIHTEYGFFSSCCGSSARTTLDLIRINATQVTSDFLTPTN